MLKNQNHGCPKQLSIHTLVRRFIHQNATLDVSFYPIKFIFVHLLPNHRVGFQDVQLKAIHVE
jgi:hypothetical protein